MVQMMMAACFGVALVPAPRQMELRDGTCAAETRIEERTDASLPKSGYELTVADGGVTIVSSDADGAFYARETLKQLAEVDGGKTNYPCCRIVDSPRYAWRGCLIDEGRHFFGKATVKRMIEAMAYHKLNVLHWHLTEDQGWRIDLRKWPELAKWGAARAESPIPGKHNLGDGRPYGPYFYTEEDIAEIVEFAEAHHVKIVPELEIPGHSRAALAAYPQFSCLGERLERRPDTSWGVKRELYCAGNDEAIGFLESVLDEFCRLFKYSDTVHIGGDECPKTRWRNCPKCQARMKALGLRDEDALQTWMTRHFTEYLSKKGKRAIGWEEILDGGVPAGTAVMSWLGPKGALKAVTNGVDCVVCPTTYTYLDQRQDLAFDPWRTGKGGLSLAKVYGFDPADGIPEEAKEHVIGSEGLLWTESITDPEELMWMGFPRLCAVAEVLWTADPKRDYAAFAKRLETHIPRLRAMGVNSAPTPEGLPRNVAVEPVSRLDVPWWKARHDYVLAESKTWRSNPKVVFLGDSITHNWTGRDSIGELDDSLTLPRWKQAMGGFGWNAMGFGYGGDQTQHLLWRLRNGEIARIAPELVVVMIGVNNVWPAGNRPISTPEETVSAIRQILAEIRRQQPKAKILLMGVLPAHEKGSKIRHEVDRINRLLARIPSYEPDGKIRFLDIGERYLGANGEIPRALMPDLVHPSDAGYAIWAKAIRPYLEEVDVK